MSFLPYIISYILSTRHCVTNQLSYTYSKDSKSHEVTTRNNLSIYAIQEGEKKTNSSKQFL